MMIIANIIFSILVVLIAARSFVLVTAKGNVFVGIEKIRFVLLLSFYLPLMLVLSSTSSMLLMIAMVIIAVMLNILINKAFKNLQNKEQDQLITDQ